MSKQRIRTRGRYWVFECEKKILVVDFFFLTNKYAKPWTER